MIRNAISPAAFDAICATLPLGSVSYEPEVDAKGEMHIWIDDRQADRLSRTENETENGAANRRSAAAARGHEAGAV